MPDDLLILDADRPFLLRLRRFFEDRGLRVATADRFPMGLDLLSQGTPRGLLLSGDFPGAGSLEFLKAARQAQPGLSVIWLSQKLGGEVDRELFRRRHELLAVLDSPPDLEDLAHFVLEGMMRPVTGAVPGLNGDRSAPTWDAERQGELSDSFPVAAMLGLIYHGRLSGLLDLSDSQQGSHRRLYLQKGSPIFLQSNLEGEDVATLLIRRGRLTEPDRQRCLAHIESARTSWQEALRELKLVSEKSLSTAYRLLAEALFPLALAMRSGSYHWRASDAFVGRVPEVRFELPLALAMGVQSQVSPVQVMRFFHRKADFRLRLTKRFAELWPSIKRVFPEEGLLERLERRPSLGRLMRSRLDRVSLMPAIYTLVCLQMVQLEDAPHEPSGDLGGPSLELGLKSMDHYLDFQTETFGLPVVDDKRRLLEQNFFEIFSLPRSLTPVLLKRAYYHQRCLLELDWARGNRLPEFGAMLERVDEAYETLADAGSREAYAAYLDQVKT